MSNLTTTEQINDALLTSHLDNMGLTSSLTPPEKNTYLSICKAFNLNPFKREVHVSKYGTQMSIITGYEVYIKRAERSGQLDGWNAITSGSVATNDLKATVTIYRKDRNHAFIWEALYSECVQKTKEGHVTKFWQKADFMTKKVAISQAFRLCFSDELGGMPYTADEMPEVTQDVSHVEITIPILTDKQLQKTLTLGKDKITSALNAIEEGKLEATNEQILILETTLKNL